MKAYLFSITLIYKMLCQNQHLWGHCLKSVSDGAVHHALAHSHSKC